MAGPQAGMLAPFLAMSVRIAFHGVRVWGVASICKYFLFGIESIYQIISSQAFKIIIILTFA
jgi:hypothetical protein